jgi:hypothetical protein
VRAQVGGNTLRGAGILPGRRRPVWVRLRCGGCRQRFVGNQHSVPVWQDLPCCRGCWRRVNLIRRSAGMPEWDTPEDAYPGADPDQVRDVIAPARHPGLIVPGITDR